MLYCVYTVTAACQLLVLYLYESVNLFSYTYQFFISDKFGPSCVVGYRDHMAVNYIACDDFVCSVTA